MSDAERPTDDPAGDDEFEPIQVFPEAEEMDLRPGADDCYKCSTCDTNCPVAEVDDEFPGPKFQGPEQWRLKRQDDHDIDDSVMKCSNCMRCDSACPSDVPSPRCTTPLEGSTSRNRWTRSRESTFGIASSRTTADSPCSGRCSHGRRIS